jgi:hypothetical protein
VGGVVVVGVGGVGVGVGCESFEVQFASGGQDAGCYFASGRDCQLTIGSWWNGTKVGFAGFFFLDRFLVLLLLLSFGLMASCIIYQNELVLPRGKTHTY